MANTLSPAEEALRDAAREYHRSPVKGKISISPTKPLLNQRDLSLAYSPGVAYPCLDVMVGLGAKPANIYAVDSKGLIYIGRPGGFDDSKTRYAQKDSGDRTLADVMKNADVFLGCSAPGVVTQDMVKSMGSQPIILALANPEPEIRPELAKQVRPDCIIATGRSDYPNQVNNVLCFPYIFRGALDCGARAINAVSYTHLTLPTTERV